MWCLQDGHFSPLINHLTIKASASYVFLPFPLWAYLFLLPVLPLSLHHSFPLIVKRELCTLRSGPWRLSHFIPTLSLSCHAPVDPFRWGRNAIKIIFQMNETYLEAGGSGELTFSSPLIRALLLTAPSREGLLHSSPSYPPMRSLIRTWADLMECRSLFLTFRRVKWRCRQGQPCHLYL